MTGLPVLMLALQAATPATEFAAQARAGTERFQDPRAALTEGYRPVGPDFPAMGQHWIHPGLIVEGALEPGRPHVLEYAHIRGRLTLVGVAYVALAQARKPPATFPVSPAAWHFHGGTVSEESFIRSHAAGGAVDSGPTLAVLHAWVWLENPAGLFATDNWALPFARLGFETPDAPDLEAAKALALAAPGGEDYVTALFRVLGEQDSLRADATAAEVSRVAVELRAWVAGRAPGPLGSDDVAFLAAAWRRLEERLHH